jgi:serine/threonine protein kinase
VHRDLSARNILVTKDAEGKWLCKVADFGIQIFFFTNVFQGCPEQLQLSSAKDRLNLQYVTFFVAENDFV